MSCLLLANPTLTFAQSTRDIAREFQRKVVRGPSKRPETQCNYYDRVQQGHFVTIHYNVSIDESSSTGARGMLVDTTNYRDTEADIDFDQPLMIQVGDRQKAFSQWADALVGLCVGDRVSLIVPPEHAYGSEGNGGSGGLVPPHATLKVDVEILGSHQNHELSYKQSLATNKASKMFREMDTDGDGKVNFEEMERYLNIPEDYPKRASFIRQHFELSDYDKDGLVTLEEFKAILYNFPGIEEEPEL